MRWFGRGSVVFFFGRGWRSVGGEEGEGGEGGDGS